MSQVDTGWGQGVRLISNRPRVVERVREDGSVRPEVSEGRREVVLEGPDWRERLAEVFSELTFSERHAAQARPLADPDAAPVSLESLIERLETPWFDEVMNEGHLRPHFQPIVRLADGSVYGREALIRASLGEQRFNGGQLVDAARSHGEIFSFDQRCRTAALEHGGPQLPDGETLFINFNPSAIYDPEICLRTTWAVARRHDFSLSRVCFEVVESERFPDIEFLRTILDRYRQEGAVVALDDLGAGHTSLSYLRELRPDIVKLDRALIAGIDEDDSRRRLVGALIDYAHDLAITTVAEGIETAGECGVVRELGADLGQGWFFGRPEAQMGPVARRLEPVAA